MAARVAVRPSLLLVEGDRALFRPVDMHPRNESMLFLGRERERVRGGDAVVYMHKELLVTTAFGRRAIEASVAVSAAWSWSTEAVGRERGHEEVE